MDPGPLSSTKKDHLAHNLHVLTKSMHKMWQLAQQTTDVGIDNLYRRDIGTNQF